MDPDKFSILDLDLDLWPSDLKRIFQEAVPNPSTLIMYIGKKSHKVKTIIFRV